MIKIFPSRSSLLHTPFTREAGINSLLKEGIETTDAVNADIIISGKFRNLSKFMLRFGRRKKYLIWTLEPRYNQHFDPRISYPLLPPFHVMNIYTGILSDNYLYLRQNLVETLNFDNFSGFKNKKIVALMTYKAGHKCQLYHQGKNLDLLNLRTRIAIEGYERGILDIYGRGWPKKVKITGESRGKGWQNKKLGVLDEYHFNLSFENTNWPHYCTEKIWDSINGGCLPIYYGKGNRIYDDFPHNSFLDYCDFNNSDSLFDYIKEMNPDEFKERMNLCIQTIDRAFQIKQEKQPYQRILEQTILKIREIYNQAVY